MPSRNLSVNRQDRNDVIAFWQGVYKASEGYHQRPVFKEHTTANFYAADFTVPYVYTYNAAVNPPNLFKSNGLPASGELSLDFVKDVERRVNFHRALAGVPAGVALMDSDTQNNTSSVYINPAASLAPFQPSESTLKADAAQKSAYLIARTYKDKWKLGSHTWGMYHRQTEQIINNISAWNKDAWNGNYNSNLALGFYGPTAIDRYITEEIENAQADENSSVGHRRLVLAPDATNFATGDVPGLYNPGANDAVGSPRIRPSTNALYVIQRPSEVVTPTAQFTAYPPAGFFPAPLNTPYWSLSHPNGDFEKATVSMKTANGANVEIGEPIAVPSNTRTAVAWPVLSAEAISRTPGPDRTYHITVSNFKIGGEPTTYSYSVTVINPELFTGDQSITGSDAPPSTTGATYFFTPPSGAEAVQVSAFRNIPATWIETADAASPTVVNTTHVDHYTFISNMLSVSGGPAYRLAHPIRYDIMTLGVPEQSFLVDREIIPASDGSSKLRFSYRPGLITGASTLAIEASNDSGASWTALGALSGLSVTGNPQAASNIARTVDLPLPASTTPLKVRFRFYKSGGPDQQTYNDQEYPNVANGIFIDNITTVNAGAYQLLSTNELPPTADRLVLSSATAGGELIAGQPIHLRMRSKLGNHWFQYAPAKILTPTATPIPGFGGWFSYEYPILTGGFSGDHDGDGEANAIEFAFYNDPLKSGKIPDALQVSSAAMSAPETTARSTRTTTPPGGTFSISRPIPALRTGVNYEAEWTDTLAAGSWSSEGVVISFDGENVIATVPQGPGQRFLRWKITE